MPSGPLRPPPQTLPAPAPACIHPPAFTRPRPTAPCPQSKAADNKRTASGTLHQLIGIVFQRMEVWEQRKTAGLPPPPHAALLPPPEDSAAATKRTHEEAVAAAEAEAARAAASAEAESESAEGADPADGSGATADGDATSAAAAGDGEGEGDAGSAAAAPAAAAPAAAAPAAPAAAPESSVFPSQYHRDAFAVFRALCTISDQGYKSGDAQAASGPAAAAILVESKILSLQLLSDIIENAGEAFRSSRAFLGGIKSQLSDALLRNLLAPQPQVVQMGLRIFLQLVRSASFRPHLSEEIEVFVEEVFLALLDSPTSSFDLRLMLLQVIEALARDGTAFIELFANFDCVDGRQDLVEKVANTLAAIAQGRASASFNATQRTAEEAAAVQHQALTALLAMVHTVRGAVDETLGMPSSAAAEAEAAAAAVEAAAGKSGVTSTAVVEDDEAEDAAAAAAAAAAADPESFADGDSDAESDAATSRAGRASLAGRFEESRKERALLQRAAIKFRMKPKLGIAFLQEMGRTDGSPESIARCFHQLGDVLDKTAMGEFMGGEKDLNIAVMHAYVDQIDFSGLPFDEGIRAFLAGFRLPGEAQKIDRMMEKFAEQYCKQNVNSAFPNADSAFILAYSVIMLTTDLHNPNIAPERRMTKEGFIRNNRGVLDGKDFPREFLERIYDKIKANPISLKEIEDAKAKLSAKAAAGSAKAWEAAQQKERRDILQRTALSLQRRRMRMGGAAAAAAAAGDSSDGAAAAAAAAATAASPAGSGGAASGAGSTPGGNKEAEEAAVAVLGDASVNEFRQWSHGLGEILGPMLSTLWGPFTAAVSVLLERSDDGRVVGACLHGIRHFVSAAGRLGLATERDAVVSALAKFTALGVQGAMSPKNVLTCRAVVDMAVEDGETLGTAWPTVLHCLSVLARLHVEAKGAREDAAFFPDHSSRPAPGGRRGASHGIGDGYGQPHPRMTASQAAELATAERRNAAMVQSSIAEGRIERVYAMSAQLSSDAIVDFVNGLCAVSIAELRLAATGSGMASGLGGGSGPATAAAGRVGVGPSSPRVFSLQKVVECADFNLEVRSRVTWSAVWSTLSQFFTLVGCHSNTALAMFAIDSLKQLSLKFLTKRELGAFHFQRMFLAPFAAIMDAQPRVAPEIRELILRVFLLLVRSKHRRLRSGWATIFSVHASAARDTTPHRQGASLSLVKLAFATVDWVVRLHCQDVARAGALGELVHCLVAFAANTEASQEISVRAVDHLVHVGAMLARGLIPTGDGLDAAVAEAVATATGETAALASAPSDGAPPTAQDEEEEEREEEAARALMQRAWVGVPVLPGAILDSKLLVDISREAELDRKAAASLAAAPAADAAASAAAAPSKAATPPAAPGTGSEGSEDAAAAPSTAATGVARRFTDSPAHTSAWWPLLTGLMRTVADPRLHVRTRALDALFALLRRFGPAFDGAFWDLVHSGVLLPIFDDVRHASSRAGGTAAGADAAGAGSPAHRSAASGSRARPQSVAQAAASAAGGGARGPKVGVAVMGDGSGGADALGVGAGAAAAYAAAAANPDSAAFSAVQQQAGASLDHSWLKTTCMPALTALVRLHAHAFRRLEPLLPNLLSLLEACADQEIEGLARIGVACFRVLLEEAAPRFGPAPWALVVASLRRLFEASRPRSLVDCREFLLGGPAAFSDDEADDHEAASATGAGAGAGGGAAAPQQPTLPAKVPPPVGASVLTRYGRAAFRSVRADGTWLLSFGGGTLYAPDGVCVIGEIVASPVGEQLRPLRDDSALTAAAQAAPVDDGAPRPLPFNSVRVVTQCVVQVELIQTVSAMAARGTLRPLGAHLVSELLDELEAAAAFARNFNADRPLRRALWRSGFMRFARQNKLPSLLRQETTASNCLVGLVRTLLEVADCVEPAAAAKPESKADGGADAAEPRAPLLGIEPAIARKEGLARLRALAQGVVWRSARMAREHAAATAKHGSIVGATHRSSASEATDRKLEREGEAFAPIVVAVLGLAGSLKPDVLRPQLSWLWPLLCDLVAHGSRDAREAVAHILRETVPQHAACLQPAEAEDSA